MRPVLASPLIVAGATLLATQGLAIDAAPPGLPLASRFDLAETAVRPAYTHAITTRDELSDQFALPELSTPPMPPHQPAKLRIRGKKLKLRLPLG